MAPRAANVDDWHDRLIIAAQARYAEAVRNNRRTLNAWQRAVDALRKSRSKIYILKSGVNKGNVTGIPNTIANVVTQVLIKIVMEEEPVLRPEHEGRLDATITDEPVVRNRQYRDSAYAILAALYVEYQGPGQNPQPTQVVKNRAKRYTDHDVEGNYMAGTHGAWEANKQLKQKGLITVDKQGRKFGDRGMHAIA